MTNPTRSPHTPLVSRRMIDQLASEHQAYGQHWTGAALSKLEAVRAASVALLESALNKSGADEPALKIESHVVERYAGYRGQEHNRF